MILWKKEVDEINSKVNEGKIEFLKLLQEKYNSYIDNKPIVFSEEDFLSDNIKRTLIRTTRHYHSDKKNCMPNIFNEKDVFLRELIIRKINNFIS